MKRILIFSLAYLPMVGGAEIAIKEITDRISREDIAFDMLTLRFNACDPDVQTVGNVRIYRVRGFERLGYVGKALFPLFAALGAYRLHKKNGYDGAWAMMSYMLLPIIFLRWLGVRLPYALTLQEGDTEAHMFGRLRILPFVPILNFGFRRAAVVQAISHFLGVWARTRGYEGPLEIIPNGVAAEKFSRGVSAEEKIALRKKYGLHESDRVLFTASRLVRKNGVDLVIRALPRLSADVKFLVAGQGSERAALEILAKELKIEHRVVFMGYVDNANLPDYLHASDIFIRASRSEGQGIAFIEAMAAGLPVVAPLVGGISDFLFDEERNPEREPTGFAIEPESPDSIVEAVQKILANPESALRIARRAQEMVLREYDWDRLVRDMRERVFAKIL